MYEKVLSLSYTRRKKLDKIQIALEINKTELIALDDLVKSRFIEMFGDPITNSKNLLELTLPELGEFGRGVSKHRPRNAPELLGGKHPLIQMGEVANAEYILTGTLILIPDLDISKVKCGKQVLCVLR